MFHGYLVKYSPIYYKWRCWDCGRAGRELNKNGFILTDSSLKSFPSARLLFYSFCNPSY